MKKMNANIIAYTVEDDVLILAVDYSCNEPDSTYTKIYEEEYNENNIERMYYYCTNNQELIEIYNNYEIVSILEQDLFFRESEKLIIMKNYIDQCDAKKACELRLKYL